MAILEKTKALDAVAGRLLQMRRLWEAAARSYFDPPEFLLNLQNCITVSRSVTFIVQSNKSKIPDFDNWYAPHVEMCKNDPIMVWAKDARNSIEKRGDLETCSQVRGEIIASYFEGPHTDWVSQDLFSSPKAVWRSVPEAYKSIPQVIENGTLLIERRWVDDQLPDREVLDALAHVYSQLATVVGSLYSHLDFEAPAEVSEIHPATMTELEMNRAIYVSMKDGSPAGMRIFQKRIDVDAKALRKRYGKNLVPRGSLANATDFKELREKYFRVARTLLLHDGYHRSFMYLVKGAEVIEMISTEHPDRASRYVMMRDLASLAKIKGADGVMFISEAWTSTVEGSPTGFAQDAPNRGECLSLIAANAEGEVFNLSAEIVRKRKKTHKIKKLGPTTSHNQDAAWLLYPFQKMWGCDDKDALIEADERLNASRGPSEARPGERIT